MGSLTEDQIQFDESSFFIDGEEISVWWDDGQEWSELWDEEQDELSEINQDEIASGPLESSTVYVITTDPSDAITITSASPAKPTVVGGFWAWVNPLNLIQTESK